MVTTPDYGELVRRLRYADQDLDHSKIAKVKETCWEAHIALEQQARDLAAARRETEEMRERLAAIRNGKLWKRTTDRLRALPKEGSQ
jgi:hypothetical protein